MACNDEEKLMTLARRDGLGSIGMCGCGTIHVSVGSVSLRLAPDAFCELVVMCRAAADALVLQARLLENYPGEIVQ